ncbi:MAG: hypothetical protein J6M60_05880 [Clostridia bacterium]|nr:hypothetical protein [Clostridia bacterium]
MKEILEKNVEELSINQNAINTLEENNINTVCDICKNSRIELTGMGLSNSQINEITVFLQLQGLDLKPNHAQKNIILDKCLARR